MHCPRPIGGISTHSSGYHEERTGDSTTYLASKAGQSRQVALNLGSHRSENTGWGWCWPRLIDKVLTRHVDPGPDGSTAAHYGSDGSGDFFVPKHVRWSPMARPGAPKRPGSSSGGCRSAPRLLLSSLLTSARPRYPERVSGKRWSFLECPSSRLRDRRALSSELIFFRLQNHLGRIDCN
jgi:hypothetical protein